MRGAARDAFVKHVLGGLLAHVVPLRKLFAPLEQLPDVFLGLVCNLSQPASFELLYEAPTLGRPNDALFYRGFAPPHGVFWQAMFGRSRLWFGHAN